MRYKDQILTINFAGNPVKVIQVNKTTAKKIFESGKDLYIHPNNAVLNNPWILPLHISNEYRESFDAVINEAMYYLEPELGKYFNFFKVIES